MNGVNGVVGVLKQNFVQVSMWFNGHGKRKRGRQALPLVTRSLTFVRVKGTISDVRHMLPDVRQGVVMRTCLCLTACSEVWFD